MPTEWVVVGGTDKGGILVREGLELKSPQAAERLACGSIVEQLERIGDRLHYKLYAGKGPPLGWVSIRLGDKELLTCLDEPGGDGGGETPKADDGYDSWVLGKSDGVRTEEEIKADSADQILAAIGRPYEVLGLAAGAGSNAIRRAYHSLSLIHHPDKGGDAAIFKAISDAYKALTSAKGEADGWRDIDDQAVGPWKAHPPSHSGKGVTCMLFDAFGAPPWESRRLYTGSWDEATIKCWELSKGDPAKGTKPPPRLIGEIKVGGFVNDLAALSPFGLLTAQSAGMKPLPGESLRSWDLKLTPFKVPTRAKTNAIADVNQRVDALTDDSAGSTALAMPNEGPDSALAVNEDKDSKKLEVPPMAEDESGYLQKSKMVFVHYRGVRSLSLWPRPDHQELTPILVGSVSKDVIAVSKVGVDGCSLDQPVWQQQDPHGMSDVNIMKHQTMDHFWTGDNNGTIKCWDVNTTANKGCITTVATKSGWISKLELFPNAGVLVASHSSGLIWMDMKSGEIIRQQYTKEACLSVCLLNEETPSLFAGVGKDVNQYDTRCLKDSPDSKPGLVTQWSLQARVSSLHCTKSAKGHILVAVGSEDGKVAAFDTS